MLAFLLASLLNFLLTPLLAPFSACLHVPLLALLLGLLLPCLLFCSARPCALVSALLAPLRTLYSNLLFFLHPCLHSRWFLRLHLCLIPRVRSTCTYACTYCVLFCSCSLASKPASKPFALARLQPGRYLPPLLTSRRTQVRGLTHLDLRRIPSDTRGEAQNRQGEPGGQGALQALWSTAVVPGPEPKPNTGSSHSITQYGGSSKQHPSADYQSRYALHRRRLLESAGPELGGGKWGAGHAQGWRWCRCWY